jgi:hypothetical protein
MLLHNTRVNNYYFHRNTVLHGGLSVTSRGATTVQKLGGPTTMSEWGGGNCERRRREAAIAEGKKPLTTRGMGERRKLPHRGLGRSPRS